VVDPRLEPAAHANAKDLLPKGHWIDAFGAASGDLPDGLGNAADSARRLMPRSIPSVMT
jgi:hypothetical protein